MCRVNEMDTLAKSKGKASNIRVAVGVATASGGYGEKGWKAGLSHNLKREQIWFLIWLCGSEAVATYEK